MQIATMVRAELYVRQNEATSRLVFIHAYTSVNTIPFELEANAKVSISGFWPL